MDELTKIVAQTLKTTDQTAGTILIAGLVGLITILLIAALLARKKAAKGNTILLVGLSDGGKTLMFRQFVTNHEPSPPESFTSMKENVYSDLSVGNEGMPIRLVDFPGADKLRKRLFDQYLSAASAALKGIIFVVDSGSFTKMSKDVAEFMYNVLVETPNRIPLLVACNKQDMPLAKSSQVIRSGVEKEFGLLNRTRAASLEMTDGGSGKKILGKPDKDFKLDDLNRDVSFVECCCMPQEEPEEEEEENLNLDSVEHWILNL